MPSFLVTSICPSQYPSWAVCTLQQSYRKPNQHCSVWTPWSGMWHWGHDKKNKKLRREYAAQWFCQQVYVDFGFPLVPAPMPPSSPCALHLQPMIFFFFFFLRTCWACFSSRRRVFQTDQKKGHKGGKEKEKQQVQWEQIATSQKLKL